MYYSFGLLITCNFSAHIPSLGRPHGSLIVWTWNMYISLVMLRYHRYDHSHLEFSQQTFHLSVTLRSVVVLMNNNCYHKRHFIFYLLHATSDITYLTVYDISSKDNSSNGHFPCSDMSSKINIYALFKNSTISRSISCMLSY